MKYTDEELAEAHIFPISEEERKQSHAEMAEYIRNRVNNMTEEEKLRCLLLQIKYKREDAQKNNINNS